jgi:hypothetical protein
VLFAPQAVGAATHSLSVGTIAPDKALRQRSNFDPARHEWLFRRALRGMRRAPKRHSLRAGTIVPDNALRQRATSTRLDMSGCFAVRCAARGGRHAAIAARGHARAGQR